MGRMVIGVTPYFDYNRKTEYMPEGYSRGVEHMGASMISLHYDLAPEKMREVLSQVDAVIFSGGVDMHPRFYGQAVLPQCDDVDERRDLMELSLFEMAVQKNLPMLGICRGIQLLNVAMGGTLIQDIPSQCHVEHQQKAHRFALWHDVKLVPVTPLSELYGGAETLYTNSFHHQGILDLAPGLTVNAMAAEGFPEAFTSQGSLPILGVQWHPEVSFCVDDQSPKIFDLFRTMVESHHT